MFSLAGLCHGQCASQKVILVPRSAASWTWVGAAPIPQRTDPHEGTPAGASQITSHVTEANQHRSFRPGSGEPRRSSRPNQASILKAITTLRPSRQRVPVGRFTPTLRHAPELVTRWRSTA